MLQPYFNGSILGPCAAPFYKAVRTNGGLNTYAMALLDAGFCARHEAKTTLDVKAIKIIWNALTAPGTVAARYETMDATSGKPTGTLYDASATKSFTPASAGSVQTITFDTLPTTGRTLDTMYGVVLITTGIGTTQTLRSHIAVGGNAAALLTTATAVTRSSFAVVNQSTPAVVLVMEDDSEEVLDMVPYSGVHDVFDIYGADRACAAKFTLNASQTIAGVYTSSTPSIIGTPAGDFRVRILDASNNLVTGTSRTLDKDYVTASGRDCPIFFTAPATIPAGTYKIVADSTGSVNFSNCFRINGLSVISATAMNSGFIKSSTTNMSGAFTWSDDSTVIPGLGLIYAVDVAPAAGGMRLAGHGGLAG